MEFENPKLFVGSVAEETDEETLRQHFGKYGEVKHVLVIADKRIGFVTFSDPLMAKNALQEDHIILGRKVVVKPAEPRTQTSNTKIFVGGLPPTIKLEEFKEYFGSYGTITDAALIYDKETRKFRGFGFVTYDSDEAAADVLRNNFHELNNKMVEVKRAKPKDKAKGINIRDCDRQDDCYYYYYYDGAVADHHHHHHQWDGIYNVNAQPVFGGGGGGFYCYAVGCCAWVPAVAVADGYEPSFGSYDQLYYHHGNSNSWWEQEWKAK